MLLQANLGFWRRMVQKEMQDTHFLIQEENFAFDELVRASALPSFISKLVIKREGDVPNRVIGPISDEKTNATYYIICKTKQKAAFRLLFESK